MIEETEWERERDRRRRRRRRRRKRKTEEENRVATSVPLPPSSSPSREGGRTLGVEGVERDRERDGCLATTRGVPGSIDRYPATSWGAGCEGGRGETTPLARWLYYPPPRSCRCCCSNLLRESSRKWLWRRCFALTFRGPLSIFDLWRNLRTLLLPLPLPLPFLLLLRCWR